MRKIAAVATLAAGILALSAGALGATSTGCGTYSYGFTGTRLLNDGISTSAGPFSIDLPAGTYDITMVSGDNHPSPDYQTDQTEEQWYFTLDNGFVSTFTTDVANDHQTAVSSMNAVDLSAATAISVHHRLVGSINSVNVECIGFTTAETVARTDDSTTTPTIAGPTTTIAETQLPEAQTADTAVQTTVVSTTDTATDNVSTEVKGTAVVAAAPQLALTGRTSGRLVGLGLGLLTFGLILIAGEHLSTTRRIRSLARIRVR